MHGHRYNHKKEIGLATMLSTKRSTGFTPEVNLGELVTCVAGEGGGNFGQTTRHIVQEMAINTFSI